MTSFAAAQKPLLWALQHSGLAFALSLGMRSIALLAVLHSQNNDKN